MRTMFKLSLGAALVVAAIGFAPAAYAFHDGGVAECEGCHTMHNSEGGKAVSTLGGLTQFKSGPFLLQGNTQSEACLNCHNSLTTGSYHISTDGTLLVPGAAPINYTAGGDFGWLKKTYTWVVRGSNVFSVGQDHGHNIVAPAFNFLADTTRTAAPGGTFLAANLQCSSCHDPHGKYRQDANGTQTTTGLPIGNSGSYTSSAAPTATFAVGVYRLLGGAGYLSSGAPAAFTGPSPSAVAAGTYNKVESDNGTGQVRVAYGKNMSEWCANCHGSILTTGYMSGQAGFTHPAGATAKFGTDELANYGSYVKSGTLTGTAATSYWTLAPFETGSAVLADLKTAQASFAGPDASSNVACVSCHRAHASGFDSMLRFNTTYEMITDGTGASGAPTYVGTTNVGQGRTEAEMTAAYYGRPATVFSSYQRDLCNKCHAKD
jgi:hypothetical protein